MKNAWEGTAALICRTETFVAGITRREQLLTYPFLIDFVIGEWDKVSEVVTALIL